MKTSLKATLLTSAALIASAGLLIGWTTGTTESENTTVVTTTSAEAEPFSVDGVHSSVFFKIRHIGSTNFYGRFNEVSGSFSFDEDAGTLSDVSIEIPVASVDTNNESRDGHIKGGDFFNVGQYPTASFTSTGFTATDQGGTLTGNLTFHGVTNEITATVRDIGTGEMRGTKKMGFEAVFTFKRSDYEVNTYLPDDLSDNGALGNTITLTVAIEANAS